MVQNVKKTMSYEDQIKRLRDFHRLSIDDDGEALKIFKKINYCRLSGYGIGLTSLGN